MQPIEFKWIHFVTVDYTGKTYVFDCYNRENNAFLGKVKWYGGFRKYSFFPANDIVFETQCLKDIASFLDRLMIERKITKQSNNG